MKVTRAEWDALKAATIDVDGEAICPWAESERIIGKERTDKVRWSYPGDSPWAGVHVEIDTTADPDFSEATPEGIADLARASYEARLNETPDRTSDE